MIYMRRYSAIIRHVCRRNTAMLSYYRKLCDSHTRLVCVNMLQLNPDKTEIIWFGSKTNTANLHKKYISLRLESVVTNPFETLRDFGVKTVQRADHAFIYCQNSIVMFFYHLRRLWQLRRLADQPAMKRLVSAFVITRLDYCNSL